MQPKQINSAVRHLKKEGKLAGVIKANPRPDFSGRKNPYHALVRTIIYQQLSGKAAGTIKQRFLDLYPNVKHPKPEDVLATSDHKFRTVGLSLQKVSYIKDLSQKFSEGYISTRKLNKITDDEVREHLLKVKGIGNWTVDMFMMFTLYRPDILPTGDLGIQKGFQRIFKLKKLPEPKKMITLAQPWQPYRTIASWYLWRTIDGDEEGDW
jgi:DNA-3-methyladenine glycosylase II